MKKELAETHHVVADSNTRENVFCDDTVLAFRTVSIFLLQECNLQVLTSCRPSAYKLKQTSEQIVHKQGGWGTTHLSSASEDKDCSILWMSLQFCKTASMQVATSQWRCCDEHQRNPLMATIWFIFSHSRPKSLGFFRMCASGTLGQPCDSISKDVLDGWLRRRQIQTSATVNGFP